MQNLQPARQPAGPRTKLFCDYHAGYNAGHSIAFMRYCRLQYPGYRENERKAVKERMRKLRATRKSAQERVTG
jgi:hypothetical protein